MRIFVDTNVFLDYIQERVNLQGKDISEAAAELFMQTVNCNFEIVISTKILEELQGHAVTESVRALFAILGKKILIIPYTKKDIRYAKKLTKTHLADALHIIVAQRANVEYIVTRNLRDFLPYNSILQAKLPDELIL